MNSHKCNTGCHWRAFLHVSRKRKYNETTMKAFHSVYLLPCVLDVMRESVFELTYRKTDKCLRVCSCAAAAQLVKSQVSLHRAGLTEDCTLPWCSHGSRTVTESEVNSLGHKQSELLCRAAANRLLVGLLLLVIESHVNMSGHVRSCSAKGEI